MRSVLFEIPRLPAAAIYVLIGVVAVAFVVRLLTAWRAPDARKEFPSILMLSALMAAAFVGLFIYWRGNPILVRSYGFMLMIGFAAGTLLAMREAKRKGMEPEVILDFAIWALLASIVTARLVYVMLNPESYEERPTDVFKLWGGGLSFHGGLIGGVIALIVFCHRRKLSFWTMSDVITPSVPLGYALTRFGCFLNGCCYGAPTDLPWACVFPDDHNQGLNTPPSHPTQIYSLLLSLVVFGVLWGVRQRMSFSGQLFCLYLIFYSVERFIIEFFRKGATAEPFMRTSITQAQAASLALIVLAALMWRTRKRLSAKEKLRAAPVEPPSPTRKKKKEKVGGRKA
jgi:phosphatidylglycerol:prolipoprotein diacylglycerol transferase